MTMTQYRMLDSDAPQAVTVEFDRVIAADDDARPHDYADAIGEDRVAAWMRGEWSYVGIYVAAHVRIPVGGKSFATYTLTSPGIWGVEDDSGEEYLTALHNEQVEVLKHDLRALAGFINAGGLE